MAQSLRLLASEFVSNPPKDVQLWANHIDEILRARVTLIDDNGVVLADSRNDPETMENHRGRPEVIAALAGRSGSAVRRSATMDVDFSYRAIPLDAPGRPRIVLRLAVPLTQVAASIAAMRSLIFRASLAAALIAMILAYFFARMFASRIRRIENYAKELVNEDYSKTLLAESDDELGSAGLLRLLQKFPAGQMCLCCGLNFVILQATDRAVHFQHSEGNIVIAADAVLAQCSL